MWNSRAYLFQDESTAFPSVPDPFLIETNLNTRAIAGLLTNHPSDVAPRCSEVLSSVSTVKLFPGMPRPGVSWGSGDLGCVAGVEIHTTGDACSCSYCSAWCSHSFEAQRDFCHSVLSHAFPISCLRSSPRPILLALCGLKSCENVSFWGIQRGWSDRLEANDYLLDLYIFQQSEPQMTCWYFFLWNPVSNSIHWIIWISGFLAVNSSFPEVQYLGGAWPVAPRILFLSSFARRHGQRNLHDLGWEGASGEWELIVTLVGSAEVTFTG